jgi:aspartate racemase
LIQRASGLPLIDLIETGAQAAAASGAARAGVIGAKGALKLYREYLAAQAMGLVGLSPAGQETFMQLLSRIKAGDTGPEVKAGMVALAEGLIADGAEVVVAGCTEAPLVLGAEDLRVEFIDPGDLLARRCVAVCLGMEPIPAISA